MNCTLRQKNTFSTNQTQRLIREKLDLEVQLKEKENFIHQVKDRIGDDLLSPTSSIVKWEKFIFRYKNLNLLFCFKNPTEEFAMLEANRPRFTLEELRQVLWERNDLKIKLWEVEQELRLFKEQ